MGSLFRFNQTINPAERFNFVKKNEPVSNIMSNNITAVGLLVQLDGNSRLR